MKTKADGVKYSDGEMYIIGRLVCNHAVMAFRICGREIHLDVRGVFRKKHENISNVNDLTAAGFMFVIRDVS